MDEKLKLRFKIGAYTPDTIPMERLAQYMSDLAAMLGEQSAVHFVELKEGSTEIVHKVDYEAYPTVLSRVDRVRQGIADVVYMDAFRSINKRLKDDNAVGGLFDDNQGGELLEFSGRYPPESRVIAPIKQPGTIDGVVISLGGRDNTVPVRVQDGDTIHRCSTSRDIAKHLGQHIFGADLRFAGVGTWTRDEHGSWSLKVFEIQSFEPLDTTPLDRVVSELRAIRGAEWTRDTWDELQELRGDDEVH
ncbi:hypothetical protein SAMN02745172_04055 [Pseudoxanthobacter soli DSM 19599]|uniref:Uncharacterized protein n=1 Tax=Pseudoxanthobacter soli DSM 19599 TaxID=1123029 RepID=A0A1M7ZR75_9HYPH|nr:hypothetical protein [Pseudoxanthobacter soli]SHO67377.1 hypothetical protein SAMN02745172_04055 [Pseudoxanthobacter soli DSM 19599]